MNKTKLYPLEEADRYKIINTLTLRERSELDKNSIEYLTARSFGEEPPFGEKEKTNIELFLKQEAAQDDTFGEFSRKLERARSNIETNFLPFAKEEERIIEDAENQLPILREEFSPTVIEHEYMYDRDGNLNKNIRTEFQRAYINQLLYDNGLVSDKNPKAEQIVKETDKLIDTYSDTPEADKLFERTLAEEELFKVLNKDITGVEFLGKFREDEKVAPRIVEPIKDVNFILVDSVRENQILIDQHDNAHYLINDRNTIDSFENVEEKRNYMDKMRKALLSAKEKINAKLKGEKDNSKVKGQHLYTEPEETSLDAKRAAGRIDNFKDIKDVLISHSYAQHQKNFMSLDADKGESMKSFEKFQEEREGIKNGDVNYLMNYIERNDIKFATIPFDELNRYNEKEQQKYLVQGDELKKRFLAMEEKFEKGSAKEAIKKNKEKEVERV